MSLPVSALKYSIAGLGLLALAACSDPEPPAQEAAPKAEAKSKPEPRATQVQAPAGQYQVDPNHAHMAFSVNHLGLSNYVARFAKFDVIIDLQPDNPSASSVSASIDPTSVRTDFMGDYKATHEDSPFDSWNQALAQDERFFNAGQYPQITFDSTSIKDKGAGKLEITGDLSLRGQTHPLTLQAEVVGNVAESPFTGNGAIGFSATGSFDRTAFGMDYLTDPPLVGKEVTLLFEGEFNQMVEETPAAATE